MKTKILLLWLIINGCFMAQGNSNNSVWENIDKFTIITAPSIFKDSTILNKTVTANFEVVESENYYLPLDVREALDYAVEIWSRLLNTETSWQTIKIFVEYKDLGNSKILAECGPASYYNSSSLPLSNINYPIALAEDILGQNLNGTDYEIKLTINSTDSITFYTGVDEAPQSGKIDLVSTLLHELAHGLGFASSMKIKNNLGYWGYDSVQTNSAGHFPNIYDYYCSVGNTFPANDKLINYQSGSSVLASKLKSNNLFFSGPKTREVNNFSYPKLFAPTTWKKGSSISHLDDTAFDSTNNALMTHSQNTAEVIRSPGVIGLTVLEDLGWKTNRLVTIDTPKKGELLTKGSTYTIKWSDNDGSSAKMNLYKVVGSDQLSFVRFIANVSGLGSKTQTWNISTNRDTGEYRIKIEDNSIAHEISPKFNISNSYKVSSPIITPPSGEYAYNQQVSISCPTKGATIYYTTNGLIPDSTSKKYTGVFHVNPPCTIKAIATKSGITQSNVASVTYTLQSGVVSIVQKDMNNNKFGHAYIWSFTFEEWVKLNEDKNVKFNRMFFRADTNFKQNTTQKFKRWAEVFNQGPNDYCYTNHSRKYNPGYSTREFVAEFDEAKNTSLKINVENTFDLIPNTPFQIKDPWFRDYNSGSMGIRNRTNPIWHPVPFNLTTSSNHKGVFLGQGYNPTSQTWNPPYYSVKATSPQTIYVQGKNRKFYFQNWEAYPSGSADFQNLYLDSTAVVFNSANATVKAVMKGTGLSNNSGTYAHNNQRKIVKTDNGNLHRVYESLGKVWYECSTDGGENWAVMNNGLAISGLGAKSSSIDYAENKIAIAFQEGDYIKVYYFRSSTSYSTTSYYNVNLGYDAEPVIALNTSEKIMVVYKHGKTSDKKLKVLLWKYDNGLNLLKTEDVPQTNGNSTHPTIAKDITQFYFHLAWQQNGGWAETSIKYLLIQYFANNNTFGFQNYSEPSDNGGYTTDKYPSITCSDGIPTVAWVSEDEVIYFSRVGIRQKGSGTSWGTTEYLTDYDYDDEINVSINNLTDDEDGNEYMTSYVVEGDKVVYYLPEEGEGYISPNNYDDYVQVCNGESAFDDAVISTYNIGSAPYVFHTSTIWDNLSKTSNDSKAIKGRELTVTKNGRTTKIILNAPTVNGKEVNFVDVDDTTAIKTKEEALSLFTTEEFELNNNSDFSFTLTSATAENKNERKKETLSEDIKLNVLLLDAKTNEQLGVLKEVSSKKITKEEREGVSYKVNTKGIGKRKVKLLVSLDPETVDNITIAKTSTLKNKLNKEKQTEINLDEDLMVTEYGLSQNYPNPFNPTTTISYQIPEDGFVSLKVYDITGQEVMTLVNKEQTIGKYKVTFDASGLSSGVYLYRIQSGGFTKSMKMILLK